MTEKSRITAIQARNLSGFQSELDEIDRQIRKAAEQGKRFVALDYVRIRQHEWLEDIRADLLARGFYFEETKGPVSYTVKW